jgi:hypothetical protein
MFGEEEDEDDLFCEDDVVVDDKVVSTRYAVNVRPKTLKVPCFPQYTQLPIWRTQVATNLVHTSKYGDNAEIAWFKERMIKTFEELGDPGSTRMRHADSLIASALIDKLPEKLMEEVRRMQVEAMALNKIITGRRMCRKMCKRIAASDHASVVFRVNDLLNLGWLGDEKMDEFVYMWWWIPR